MKLKIVQCGELVLRSSARPVLTDEIRSKEIKQLIELMRQTMLDASGVGLAAPQVGQGLQLAVIEDRADNLSPEVLKERQRTPVPFQVLINPRLYFETDTSVEFFEGCLSLTGYTALVPRRLAVKVECLDELGEPRIIRAEGWFARILQHEIDHLKGNLYLDHMYPRTFMSQYNYDRFWREKSVEQVRKDLQLEM